MTERTREDGRGSKRGKEEDGNKEEELSAN